MSEDDTLTVGELIEKLKEYDSNIKVKIIGEFCPQPIDQKSFSMDNNSMPTLLIG